MKSDPVPSRIACSPFTASLGTHGVAVLIFRLLVFAADEESGSSEPSTTCLEAGRQLKHPVGERIRQPSCDSTASTKL